jgi:hypothetical protein
MATDTCTGAARQRSAGANTDRHDKDGNEGDLGYWRVEGTKSGRGDPAPTRARGEAAGWSSVSRCRTKPINCYILKGDHRNRVGILYKSWGE